MALKGRVAEILDRYRVVINLGNEQGVKEGMRFAIYKPGKEIVDPETGKSLGRLELVLGKVRVSSVQEHMCIAMSDETYTTYESSILSYTQIFPQERTHTRALPLKEGLAGILKEAITVEVGDPVRQIE